MESRRRRRGDAKNPGNKRTKKMSEEEEMREVFHRIQSQITKLNNTLLTIGDINSFELLKYCLDAGEIVLSWRMKRPDLISEPVFQQTDDCWAHALARALAALMKLCGVTETELLPTAEKLLAKIDKKLLSATNLLQRTIEAAPSILLEYGYELKVHHRPKLHLVEENKEFERFIERLLAKGQVAMCFPYVEGYQRFQGEYPKKKVFLPSVLDTESMRWEKLDSHCAVITGRGMVLNNDVLTEFWEIQETLGGDFADNGFTRLGRHKMLVNEVYEFKRVAPQSDA